MTRRALLLFLVGAGLVLGACQEYVFEPVVPSVITVSNKDYYLPDTSKADILFVIDDSLSMAGEQENLAANFEAFVTALEQKNAERVEMGKTPVDYRLAVTSTSISMRYLYAGNEVYDTTYEMISADCRTPYAINKGDAFPDGKLLAAPGNEAILERKDFEADRMGSILQFQQNVKLGVCGSGQEMGLWAVQRALERNPDFLRPESRLVVAILSDEEDCSDKSGTLVIGSNGSVDVCVEETLKPDDGVLGPVQDYIDFVKQHAAAKGGDAVAGVITSAERVGDEVVPAVCSDPDCEASCTQGSDPRGNPCWCGAQSEGTRYLEFAAGLENSLADSICQSNFSTTLERLADTIVPVSCIDLQDRPFDDDPSFVMLKIEKKDGDTVVCSAPAKGEGCDSGADWAYTAPEGGNPPKICFCEQQGSACIIEPGDSYRVSFVEQACSEQHPCTP